MFEGLKEFITSLASEGQASTESSELHDLRLAAAALLFHVADLDGQVRPAEIARLRALIADRFSLDAGQTARLIAEAREVDRQAVDLFHFTSVLKRSLDHEGRLKVIEMMWDMAFADGHTDELEETTIWRAAELLGVSTRERVALRQRAAHRNAEEPGETLSLGQESPWGAADGGEA